MKRIFYILFWVVLGCSHLTACGTIISLTEGNYSLYAGVKKDLNAIQDGGVIGILAIADLPLCFVFDTLLLPITLQQ